MARSSAKKTPRAARPKAAPTRAVAPTRATAPKRDKVTKAAKATNVAENSQAGEPEKDKFYLSSDLAEVVQDYMPLIRHAVNRIAVGSSSAGILQYEDMLSYGTQGLIEAFHAYDPGRGAKFSTYALPRIRGAILDALRAAHPLPRSLQKFSSDMEQASAALRTSLGRTPTRAEIAKEMGLAQADFLNTMRTSNIRVVSLDGLADTAVSGNTEKLWEMADEDPGVDPDSMAQDTMVRRLLHDAVDTLPEREKTIVNLYYIRSQSLKSIGKALGISESRASQLRHRAIRRLRSALNEELSDAA